MSKILTNNKKWEDYSLDQNLISMLYAANFDLPSVTQQQFLEQMKKDETQSGFLEAPTGTGKTLCYLIQAYNTINTGLKKPQAVIICNTAILCKQVYSEAQRLFKDKITATLCLGIQHQNQFNESAQIVVATIGSFISNFLPKVFRGKESSALYSKDGIKVLLVDEADHFFENNNSQEQLLSVINHLGKECQVIMFSATLSDETTDGMKKRWLDKRSIFIAKKEIIMDNTIHSMYYIDETDPDKILKDKLNMLTKVFQLDCYEQGYKAIVFCKTKVDVDEVAQRLTQMQYKCSRYHSEMDEPQKNENYINFLNGEHRVLITTDMMSRGIDITTISIVINFDIPIYQNEQNKLVVNPIAYIHRTGRAGRFARKCVAVTTYSKEEKEDVEKIKKYVCAKYNTVKFIDLEDKGENAIENIVDEQLQADADEEVEKLRNDGLIKTIQNEKPLQNQKEQKKTDKKSENKEEDKQTDKQNNNYIKFA